MKTVEPIPSQGLPRLQRGRRAALVLAAAGWPLGSRAFDLGALLPARGSGHVTRIEYTVGAFSAITVGGSVKLVLEQGQPSLVSVETDDNLQSHIDVQVAGGTLSVQRHGNISPTRLSIVVKVWNLQALNVAGSALVSAPVLVAQHLQLKLSGAGVVHLDALTTETLDVEMGGSAVVKVSGQANELNLSAGGAAQLDAYALRARRATVSVGGSAAAQVWASETLSGSVGGAGSLRYRGEPQLSVARGGAGRVSVLR